MPERLGEVVADGSGAALIVDAKDDMAEAFYRHHGFLAFGSLPKQFVLPLAGFAKTAKR
jgi:hypothetical protein